MRWMIFSFMVQSFSFIFFPRVCRKTSTTNFFQSTTRTCDCVSSKDDNVLSISTPLELNRYIDSLRRIGNQEGVADLISKIISDSSTVSNISISYSQNFNVTFNGPIILDRISCNMGIQAFLNLGKISLSEKVLAYMQENNISLCPDTVHILLSNSFRMKEYQKAKKIYQTYFNRGDMSPTVRTLNIMIDGFRASGESEEALKYFNLFEEYQLQPDKYTYSALVRIFESKEGILDVVERARIENSLSLPLLRCAIESLGKLGYLSEAVVLFRLREPLHSRSSSFDARHDYGWEADIDALLVALLYWMSIDKIIQISEPKTPLEGIVNGLTGSEAAFSIVLGDIPISTTTTTTTITDSMSDGGSSNNNNDDITVKSSSVEFRAGAKGLCLLLTHLQRKLKTSTTLFPETSTNSPPSTNEQSIAGTLVDSSIHIAGEGPCSFENCRNRVWTKIKQLCEFKDIEPTTVSFPAVVSESLKDADRKQSPVLLNGRICDSLLRCYGTDIEGAKAIWLGDILPLARAVDKKYPGTFKEIAEKSLEALMFVSGAAGRPDSGLEIAKTVRKRNWSLEIREKLSQAYSNGKKVYYQSRNRKLNDNKLPVFSNLLDRGFESSMEAELGILFQSSKDNIYNNKGSKFPTKIRVQFTDPSSTTNNDIKPSISTKESGQNYSIS